MRKREKVERILKDNPYLKESEVAKLAGCSTIYVYKIKQKPKQPLVKIQALVPQGFKKLLEFFCEKTNMSASEFIREAIEKQFYSKELLVEVFEKNKKLQGQLYQAYFRKLQGLPLERNLEKNKRSVKRK